MNAPHFDKKNLKSPCGSAAWIGEFIAEEKRCCETIDARIDKLEDEDSALLKEAIAVEEQLKTERGLFARIKLTFKLRSIDRQREWRRKVSIELLEARIRRNEDGIREMDFQIRQAEIERHLG